MRRRKSKPGDEALLHDTSQDWAERSSALTRLAADGRYDLESVARDWLQSPDDGLALSALNSLLAFWGDGPRVGDYIEIAIEWLLSADDPDKRAVTAGFLANFLEFSPAGLDITAYRDRIMTAWLTALERDDDCLVQESCYQALLQQTAPEEADALSRRGYEPFDREREVRWDLLAPLRAQLGLSAGRAGVE